MKKILSIFFLVLLTSCSTTQQTKESTAALVHLIDSTTIIRNLIAQNRVGELLEEHTPAQLQRLLNNFSPAKIALEAEVLAPSEETTVLVYYFKNDPQEQLFLQQLEALATQYENRVKIVTVDADKLFSLAEDADIQKLPTLIVAQDRSITTMLSEDITIDHIKNIISNITQHA